ncbi:hypothetical protein [Paenibacillus sp. HB172176]|uniref:hypothetical protein n=1 Tax=Paenibacillus sp. HB172176 TaxID=2493690 RepID=UPI00143BF146|nr:hypothetical protein [Paenibacillus sp. HB172176]
MSYDLVIIGATTTALALAQTVQGSLKTLIVNATEMVAFDFVGNYKQPEVYTQGAAYNKKFRDLEADVLLGTDVVSVTKRENGNGYTLELLSAGGFYTIETKRVVDTTLEREEGLSGKSLNAIIIQQKGEPMPSLQWPGFAIVTEHHEHKYSTAILKFDCAPDWTVAEARHRLIDAWLERPEPLQSWKMAAIAFFFEERTTLGQRTRDEGYMALPAASFAEPEESLAAGIVLGRSLVAC